MAASQCYLTNLPLAPGYNEVKPVTKARTLYYEEKTVGSTSFYKCEACPYMALAEDDIKFHLFTVHPDLAKSNGLGDNVNIPCPGCHEAFDAENTLRTHLREHHKMGIRDVRKMVKSLIQIALKDIKKPPDVSAAKEVPRQDSTKIPQVIEIVPDIVQSSNALLTKGVTVISVDELQKMSTPNFEKVNPKEIIQEASINIVYSGELPSDYVTSPVVSSTLQNSTPDLISSIIPSSSDNPTNTHAVSSSLDVDTTTPNFIGPSKIGRPVGSRTCGITDFKNQNTEITEKFGQQCNVGNCGVRMVSEEKYAYHIACHQNGRLHCPECKVLFHYVKPLHTHLWRSHNIDMELNSCDECDYKTYSLKRLNSVHKMVHIKVKKFPCPVCNKHFKSPHQLTVHKLVHKTYADCSICMKRLASQRELKKHIAAVHERSKPFQCGECDYTASTKSLLKLHIRSHTGEKPYKCSQCSYESADHNALRRHKIQHSKKPVYSCKHCSYTSIQSRSYKAHMANEHPEVKSEDIYPCLYCPFQALSRDKFINHLCSHKEEGVQRMLIDLKNSQPKRNWSNSNESLPKTDWTNSSDDQSTTKWTTLSETLQKPNWNNPSENQEKINNVWNAPSDSQPKPNWNSPVPSQIKSDWNMPADNQSKPNWNTPSNSQTINNRNAPRDCHTKINWINSKEIITLKNKSNWNMPSCTQGTQPNSGSDNPKPGNNQENVNTSEQASDNITIEFDDCDSEHEIKNKSYPTDYNYIQAAGQLNNDKGYHMQENLTECTTDDNNSDCIISETSNNTLNGRLQCYSQHPMPNVSYGASNMHNDNLHYLTTTVTIGDHLLQNNNANVVTSNNSFTKNHISTGIMNNFPIQLPPNPRFSIRSNMRLTPLDKIPLPVPKVLGPIITPTQILPIPPSSNSPISHTMQQHNHTSEEAQGSIPRKKAKISVKSNLILKGPDQINLFETEQNMAFARLQESEGLNLSSPVTFNNLITTQFMQLPPEPVVNSNPDNILQYTPEPMLSDPAVPQTKDSRPLFTFNRQIDLNSINLLSQQVEHNKMSIICGNASFIKLESKQNIQSPSLERMCNTNSLIKTQEIADEYCKASPLLEDIQKNVIDIKNEIKSDSYFNMTMTADSSSSIMDQHLIDTIIGANELYSHLDLSGIMLPEITDDEQPDIIEIDDNSEDNKLPPPRFEMNLPLEYMHNDMYYMDDITQPCATSKTITEPASEHSKLLNEAQSANQSKESNCNTINQNNDFENFIPGKNDPMMNTGVRPVINKINVKNIELMKN